MLIDAHCHLNCLKRDDLERVISCSGSDYRFIDSGIDIASSKISLELSKKYDFVYSSVGFHPFEAEGFSDLLLSEYEELIRINKKIVAIGEIGLDYKAKTLPDKQEKVFAAFIDLAKKSGLPIVIHNRMKNERILDIIDNQVFSYEHTVFHCFSYPGAFLKKIIGRGAYASFSLNILRKNKDIISSLKECPPERLILETDSPYMRINNLPSLPLDIIKTYELASAVKNIDIEKLKTVVFNNAKRVFFEKEEI